MSQTDAWLTIAGLALITMISRAFFFFPKREPKLPPGIKRGLRYAPLAALAAVVVPEVVMQQGQLLQTWQDARLFAAAASAAYYVWRREMLGTIVTGMAVLLTLKLGLGW